MQCMKALHEFSNFGAWKTAWPMTHIVDPLDKYSHGGNEVEMETVLSFLKTQDDLRAKAMKGSKVLDHVSEEEGEGAEGAEGKKGKKGAGRGTTPKTA